jgi:GMP synthase (glutamine-hydrolysing)
MARDSIEADQKLPVVIVLHQEQSNPGHIGQWFTRNGHKLDIRRPRFGDPLPETLENHCGAVIFGGPMSANDPDDYIKTETDWIGVALREKKPFFGVCLGAQMLANHLGSRVYLHPQEHVEIGYYPISPTSEGAALGPWPGHFYEWHKEGFDVPHGGTVLARSNGAFPNQAFQYGPAAYGVQFHPEITYTQILRWSGNNPTKLEQPGAQPRSAHIDGHLVHAASVHTWLDAFLNRWVANTAILPR